MLKIQQCQLTTRNSYKTLAKVLLQLYNIIIQHGHNLAQENHKYSKLGMPNVTIRSVFQNLVTYEQNYIYIHMYVPSIISTTISKYYIITSIYRKVHLAIITNFVTLRWRNPVINLTALKVKQQFYCIKLQVLYMYTSKPITSMLQIRSYVHICTECSFAFNSS